MSDQQILENMTLLGTVLSGVIFFYLLGGLTAVMLAALCVHYVCTRIELRARAVRIRNEDDD